MRGLEVQGNIVDVVSNDSGSGDGGSGTTDLARGRRIWRWRAWGRHIRRRRARVQLIWRWVAWAHHGRPRIGEKGGGGGGAGGDRREKREGVQESEEGRR